MNAANLFLLISACNGFLAVCLGAFGSHALKARLSEKLFQTWSTAVEYHFYHVLAIALVAVLINQGYASRFLSASGALFAIGLVFFCGSLYWLALGGPRWLGPVTPVGGLCFIFAWLCLLIGVLQNQ